MLPPVSNQLCLSQDVDRNTDILQNTFLFRLVVFSSVRCNTCKSMNFKSVKYWSEYLKHYVLNRSENILFFKNMDEILSLKKQKTNLHFSYCILVVSCFIFCFSFLLNPISSCSDSRLTLSHYGFTPHQYNFILPLFSPHLLQP